MNIILQQIAKLIRIKMKPSKVSLISMLFSQNYTMLRKLGEGTFAGVYAARNNDTNQTVAIKQVYVQKVLLEQAMDEVFRLKFLENDHIISYKDSFYDSEQFHLNLVMEICQGSLRGLMQKETVFSHRLLQSFLVQMTCAFLELQKQHIMHLDLKPQNILIANKQGTYFKLCDFGCSQISNFSRMSGYQVTAFGTFNYLAPELHLNFEGEKTRNSADIWSLGITLYEMIFKRLPFSKQSNGMINRKDVEMYFKHKNYTINYDSKSQLPKYIVQIIKLMLKPIPTQRITWKQLKQYLIRNLNVEKHEFLNIKQLIVNFIKIFQLLLKTSKLLKRGCQSSDPFWKSEKAAASELYQEFVHYVHIVGLKFRQRSAYRWYTISQTHQTTAQKLLAQAQQMQIVICQRKQIRQFDSNDFSYQQCVTLDQMKAFKTKLGTHGKPKAQLEFLLIVFNTLSGIIEKSEGVFTSMEVFEECFKLKP